MVVVCVGVWVVTILCVDVCDSGALCDCALVLDFASRSALAFEIFCKKSAGAGLC